MFWILLARYVIASTQLNMKDNDHQTFSEFYHCIFYRHHFGICLVWLENHRKIPVMAIIVTSFFFFFFWLLERLQVVISAITCPGNEMGKCQLGPVLRGLIIVGGRNDPRLSEVNDRNYLVTGAWSTES